MDRVGHLPFLSAGCRVDGPRIASAGGRACAGWRCCGRHEGDAAGGGGPIAIAKTNEGPRGRRWTAVEPRRVAHSGRRAVREAIWRVERVVRISKGFMAGAKQNEGTLVARAV